MQGKCPIRYRPDLDKEDIYWTFYLEYDNPPAGFVPHLLPAAIFHRIRKDEGLAAERDGQPIEAIGFDTEDEAMAALRKATCTLCGGSGLVPVGYSSTPLPNELCEVCNGDGARPD